MKERIKELPYSNGNYFVDYSGLIFDKDLNIIKPFFIGDKLFVNLNWLGEKTNYLAAVVILVGLEKVRLPAKLLFHIEPLYKDSNSNNLDPFNLFYRFKNGPIEIEKYPVFYYIPFYTDYGINLEGQIINIKDGTFKKWSIVPYSLKKNTKNGYRYCSVVPCYSYSKKISLHRAMGFTFLGYGNNLWDLVVNHIDGDATNNSKDNLEWVTRKQNNVHAIENGLKPNSTRPVLMKNLHTGKITRFVSVTECSRYLGNKHNEMVWWRLTKAPANRLYPDFLQFKYDDGSDWVFIDTNQQPYRSGKASDVIGRNVFTNQRIIFSNNEESSLMLGVKKDTITHHCRTRKNLPINGWNFRFLDEMTTPEARWPNHTEKHLLIYKKYPIYPENGYICLNVETGEETFFCRCTEVMEYFNCTKSNLFTKIRRKNLFNKKYLLTVFDLHKNLGLPLE